MVTPQRGGMGGLLSTAGRHGLGAVRFVIIGNTSREGEKERELGCRRRDW